MRATVLRGTELVVADVPDPVPGPGQTLVRTLSCGICGSDLHFAQHARRMVELSRHGGGFTTLDLGRDVVMGHEFVAEVLEHGPGADASAPAPGDPRRRHAGRLRRHAARAGEPPLRRVLQRLPRGLRRTDGALEWAAHPPGSRHADRSAALTEPLAVGIHAVARSGIAPGETAVVHGCGPVGLFTIAALRLAGVETIVAADFSPTRRRLAEHLGASVVVDPRVTPAMEAWRALGSPDALNAEGRSAMVQFEAVGVPGMIEQCMREAPRQGRIVVVGACMESDTFHPIFGINKELSLQFVLGYTPDQFRAAIDAIAQERVDAAPMITGVVGIDGVAQAFADLGSPEQHVKILVEP